MDIYEIINRMRIERKRIEDFPLNVTFYARVSTMKEEQDSSIEAQISHFTETIQKNKNWTFVEGYVDRVRGENVNNRVQFQQMIEDGYAGKFDLILTKEVSRFARNTVDSLTYTRELLKHGVGVFFLTDNICTIEPDSELRLTIMSSIAQDEVRKLSERIKFGHKKSIENGHVLGNSRIFGYDKINSKLYINEYEANMVRLIFETYATGEYGLKYIEDLLWDRGYRNLNGNKIHHNTISGIIQNPKYKGYYCGNKVKIIDYRTKTQKFLPKSEWIMYKDENGETVPAIVSEDIWNKANQIFQERSMKVKATDRSAKKTSPLSGKIICGEHDTEEPFWRTSYSERLHRDKSIYQWVCRTKKRGKSCVCPTERIYERELYEILYQVIIKATTNIDEYIAEFMTLYGEELNNHNTDIEIDNLQKELDMIEKKKSKLLDLYTDDIITKQEFKNRNESLQKNIERINSKITELSKKSQSKNDIAISLIDIKEIFNNIQDIGFEDNDSLKNYIDDISEILIDRIVVHAVDKKTMKLDIKFKIGLSQEVEYVKGVRSSGIILKNMIHKRRIGNRFYIPQNNEVFGVLYQFDCKIERVGLKNHINFMIYNINICI